MRSFAFQTGMLFALVLGVSSTSVRASGVTDSTFIYQGQITQGGSPLNGLADFQFTLWDVESGGSSNIGPFVDRNAVSVVNGLFEVVLDFGADAFDGSPRWLQIAVRSPAGGGSFVILSPRQSIRSAPQSIQTRGIHVDVASDVGIGTSSPAQKLDVRGQIQVQDSIRLDPADKPMVVRQFDPMTSGPLAGFGRWGMFMEFGHLFLGVPGTDYFGDSSIGFGGWLEDSTQERWMTIREGGAVGIGTADPRVNLEVVNAIRATRPGAPSQHLELASPGPQGLFLTGRTAENNKKVLAIQNVHDGGGSPNGNQDIVFRIGQEGSPDIDIMRLTNSPTKQLTVAGDGRYTGGDLQIWSGNKALSLRQDDTNSYISNKSNFVNNGAASNGKLFINGEAGVFLTYGNSGSSGSFGLTLRPTGNVGIGTTEPLAPLDVRNGAAPLATPVGLGLKATLFAVSTDIGSSSDVPTGVLGYSDHVDGAAVVGVNTQTNGIGVASVGDLVVTAGVKSFAQPHPRDASKEIRFVALEGNESGTYFRGSSRLSGGRVVIDVPAEFRDSSEADGLTVQVTALGPNADLWVESKDLDRIVVRGNGDAEFDYFVNGVRRGFADFQVIRENRHYVPHESGKPFMTQLPEAARRILIENGTLNDDFTPNEQTAARMQWKLNEPRREAD